MRLPYIGLTEWENVIKEALSHWSSITGCDVNMVYSTSIVTPDITIAPYGIDRPQPAPNVLAEASWPSGGKPGRTIYFLADANSNYKQKVWTMVHELGHCIGLRHTNWAQIGESAGSAGAVHIPGTKTGTDSKSVMNGNAGNTSWNGFSDDDKIAVQKLYPPEISNLRITTLANPLVTGTTAIFNLSYTGSANIQSVDWSVSPSDSRAIKSGQGTKSAGISFSYTGLNVVKAIVRTANSTYECSQSFNVISNFATIKCAAYSLGPGSHVLLTIEAPSHMHQGPWTWSSTPALTLKPYQNADWSYDYSKMWVSFPKKGSYSISALSALGTYGASAPQFLIDDIFPVIIETPPAIW